MLFSTGSYNSQKTSLRVLSAGWKLTLTAVAIPTIVDQILLNYLCFVVDFLLYFWQAFFLLFDTKLSWRTYQ